jgi:hypothetical protein
MREGGAADVDVDGNRRMISMVADAGLAFEARG